MRISDWSSDVCSSDLRRGGRFFTDNSNFSVIQEMQDALYDSPIVDAMAALMGTDQVWLYYDQIFFKEGEAVRTGWHQDIPYYVMDYTDQIGRASVRDRVVQYV